MNRLVAIAAVGLVGLGVHAMPAAAERERALVRLHKLEAVGARTCMARHFHFGESGAFATRSKAEARAILSWSRFTKLEYGQPWASFDLAAERELACGPATHGRGQGWSCAAKARPCRN